MGTSVLMQDWITLQGNSSADAVVQPGSEWIDAQDFVDYTILLDVREATSNLRVEIETSPIEDESMFTGSTSFVPTSMGVYQQVVRFATATVPLARYLRWRVHHASSSWKITFRLFLILKTH